jgi:hypothetical protein
LRVIEDREQKLDPLFTDLGLGDHADGGLAVGQTMAKCRPGLPVVYTTGRGVTDGIVKLRVCVLTVSCFASEPTTLAWEGFQQNTGKHIGRKRREAF